MSESQLLPGAHIRTSVTPPLPIVQRNPSPLYCKTFSVLNATTEFQTPTHLKGKGSHGDWFFSGITKQAVMCGFLPVSINQC